MSANELRLTLSARATQDIESIYVNCAEHWGTGYADAYIERLHEKLTTIQSNPFIGRSRNDLRVGLRSFPAEHHIVCYVVTDSVVIIRTILHARMDIPRRLRL